MNTMVLLEGGESTGGALGGNMLFTVGYFVVIIALFYFMLIRPQKKRQKKEEEMRNSIAVGDTVVMTSGIVGKIICIKDDEVTIENGLSRTQLTFMKAAVSSVKVKNESGEEAQPSVDDKRAELQKKLDEKNAAKKAEREAAKNASTDDKIDLK